MTEEEVLIAKGRDLGCSELVAKQLFAESVIASLEAEGFKSGEGGLWAVDLSDESSEFYVVAEIACCVSHENHKEESVEIEYSACGGLYNTKLVVKIDGCCDCSPKDAVEFFKANRSRIIKAANHEEQ